MKKPYIEPQKIYPLDIFMDGKQIASYKPDQKRIAIDLKKAIEQIVGSSAFHLSQVEGLENAIKDGILPVIAENYADGIRQLFTGSYLYNPAFADDAKGWTISEEDQKARKVRLKISDNKIRLNLRDGGSISQSNSYMTKPGTHDVYHFDEEELETTSETAQEWPQVEIPEQKKGKTEKNNILYLSVSFVCNVSGTIQVGFPTATGTEEGILKFITSNISKSEDIQTITAQGTWDGNGNFTISVPQGEAEVISVSLTSSPIADLREQTESAISQSIQNFNRVFLFLPQLKEWIDTAQTKIEQLTLRNNNLSESLTQLQERIEALEKNNPTE